MRAKTRDSGARPRERRTTTPDGPEIPVRSHRYLRRDPRSAPRRTRTERWRDLAACAFPPSSRPAPSAGLFRRLWAFPAVLLLLLLLRFSRSPGSSCFPPPGQPQPPPVFCASATSAEGGGSMLSPQRTAAVASRGAGEASNFPRTRSAVTHAAFQCFGSEVTSRPCRLFFFFFLLVWRPEAAPPGVSAPNSGPGLLERGRFAVCSGSPRPPAACCSGPSSSALCRAGRAGRWRAPGREARPAVGLNGPRSAGRLYC